MLNLQNAPSAWLRGQGKDAVRQKTFVGCDEIDPDGAHRQVACGVICNLGISAYAASAVDDADHRRPRMRDEKMNRWLGSFCQRRENHGSAEDRSCIRVVLLFSIRARHANERGRLRRGKEQGAPQEIHRNDLVRRHDNRR